MDVRFPILTVSISPCQYRAIDWTKFVSWWGRSPNPWIGNSGFVAHDTLVPKSLVILKQTSSRPSETIMFKWLWSDWDFISSDSMNIRWDLIYTLLMDFPVEDVTVIVWESLRDFCAACSVRNCYYDIINVMCLVYM